MVPGWGFISRRRGWGNGLGRVLKLLDQRQSHDSSLKSLGSHSSVDEVHELLGFLLGEVESHALLGGRLAL